MYLLIVMDMAADRPETSRLCEGVSEINRLITMLRREYPDKSRYKMLYVPMVLSSQ